MNLGVKLSIVLFWDCDLHACSFRKYLKLKNKYDNPHILEQKFNASCKTEYKTDWLRIKLHVAVQTIFGVSEV